MAELTEFDFEDIAPLKGIKIKDSEIEAYYNHKMGIINGLKLPISILMIQVLKMEEELSKEMKEDIMQELYSDIPLLSHTIPRFQEDTRSLMSLRKKEVEELVGVIKGLINLYENRKPEILIKTVKEEIPAMTIEEIQSFRKLIHSKRKELNNNKKHKINFNKIAEQIRAYADTLEKKKIASEILFEDYGNLDEIKWGKKN